MSEYKTVPLQFQYFDPEEMCARARAFYLRMQERRSVRDFSPEALPPEVIDDAIRAAGTAPSGANHQPWHFVVVRDPVVKKQIRDAAEAEEREFYNDRASAEWLRELAPLGTDAHKPFLETAPCLIAIFLRKFNASEDGSRLKNYYTSESVGIATGMLITALHQAGVATLTHTPSPMKFLNRILERPATERPFLLLVTGFPAAGTEVPDIDRMPLADIASYF